jgi:[ribosomal protein S18]-alanine N-acetyltransferase
MEKYQIFPIKEENLDEVVEIEKLSFGSPWTFNSFVEEFSRTYSFSYGISSENDNKLRGYIVFWLLADEIHILNLAVHPGIRREGVATKLMEYLMEVSTNAACKMVFLEVRISNKNAIALYESLDFACVGRRSKYYADTKEDALLYTLFLDENLV